jgi:hypothetical protein
MWRNKDFRACSNRHGLVEFRSRRINSPLAIRSIQQHEPGMRVRKQNDRDRLSTPVRRLRPFAALDLEPEQTVIQGHDHRNESSGGCDGKGETPSQSPTAVGGPLPLGRAAPRPTFGDRSRPEA